MGGWVGEREERKEERKERKEGEGEGARQPYWLYEPCTGYSYLQARQQATPLLSCTGYSEKQAKLPDIHVTDMQEHKKSGCKPDEDC